MNELLQAETFSASRLSMLNLTGSLTVLAGGHPEINWVI